MAGRYAECGESPEDVSHAGVVVVLPPVAGGWSTVMVRMVVRMCWRHQEPFHLEIRDDMLDAGEVDAGHSVTALY